MRMLRMIRAVAFEVCEVIVGLVWLAKAMFSALFHPLSWWDRLVGLATGIVVFVAAVTDPRVLTDWPDDDTCDGDGCSCRPQRRAGANE